MKKAILFLLLLISIYSASAQSFSHIQYEGSDENFPNPERGFYHATSRLDYDLLRSYRDEESITVIYWAFKLDEFKASDIASWYLQKMEADFDAIRKAGMKAVIRFSYTEKSSPPYGDAPIDIVLRHIEQVKPILMANSDVILVVQAGFIGAWGEWYYTDYYASSPGHINEEQWGWRRAIVDSLLRAISPDRMVQLRTPDYKRHVLQQDDFIPVSEDEAFSNTAFARLGHHNDCFVAGNNDYGTYQDTAVEKPYLAKDTEYTMMGGETCNVCEYSHCENTLLELRRFHWTFLNIDYHTGVIGDWIDEGCFPDIQTKLGYRYRLVSADIQDKSKALGEFRLSLKIVNDGWSNPLNPRDIEVVLRNEENNKEYYLPLKTDPRFWPIDDTIFLSINSGIPSFVEDGNYSLYLNLPDPESNLKLRTDYAIRLANTATWDTANGYNNLLHSLNIDAGNTTDTYNGGDFFRKKNQVVLNNINIKIDGSSEDWKNVSILYADASQNANLLKIHNSNDALFFLVEGGNLHEHSRIYIDADNNSETGYHHPKWGINGCDYQIINQEMFRHVGDNNEWSWSPIGSLDGVQNEKVMELKIELGKFWAIPLHSNFQVAYVNNPMNPDDASYLPQQNTNFAIYKQNHLFSPPPALQATQYGNNALIYWTRNKNKNVRTIVEHSANGIDFEAIFSAENKSISYSKGGFDEGDWYYYRIRYAEDYQFTDFTGPVNAQIASDEKTFVRIKLDGNWVDWSPVPPAATGPLEVGGTTVRFFNTADSLYFSIDVLDGVINDYQFFFNTGETNEFNYTISNDSLFKIEGNTWSFQKVLAVSVDEHFLESGLQLSEIGFENIDELPSAAFVNEDDIWGNGESFLYRKYGSINAPENFILKPSVEDTYHTIKIQWTTNSKMGGYIIERSTNDSLHFEQIADLSPSKSYFLDNGLDSANIYIYRMFTFIGINPSAYTQTLRMKTAWVGIGENRDALASKIQIVPNPAHEQARVHLQMKTPGKVEIDLFNLNHQKIKYVFSGSISNQQSVAIETNDLSNGVYLVRIHIQGIYIYKKLIIR